jgi:hypothetical protein
MRPYVWLAWLVLAAACATGEESGTVADHDDGLADPPPVGCSATMPCEAGEACHNGACADGCNDDADCAADEYCALELGQLCQPREAATCPASACATTQSCVNGMCGTQTGTPCGPSPFDPTADGCPSDAMCLEQIHVDGVLVDARQCYTLPACRPDLTCPVGVAGAVCSAGVMPDKDPFCIPGLCLGPEHCPEAFHCVRRATNDPLGRCGDGSTGSLCATPADCVGGSCVILTPGLLGTCQ